MTCIFFYCFAFLNGGGAAVVLNKPDGGGADDVLNKPAGGAGADLNNPAGGAGAALNGAGAALNGAGAALNGAGADLNNPWGGGGALLLLLFIPTEGCVGCWYWYVELLVEILLPVLPFELSVDIAPKFLFFPNGIIFAFDPL